MTFNGHFVNQAESISGVSIAASLGNRKATVKCDQLRMQRTNNRYSESKTIEELSEIDTEIESAVVGKCEDVEES